MPIAKPITQSEYQKTLINMRIEFNKKIKAWSK